jgi:hypothetical protein
MTERENNSPEILPLELPKGATDMELVLFLSWHIDNPCSVEVSPGETKNIRDFYMREAKRLIPKLANEGAKAVLENKLKEYEE